MDEDQMANSQLHDSLLVNHPPADHGVRLVAAVQAMNCKKFKVGAELCQLRSRETAL